MPSCLSGRRVCLQGLLLDPLGGLGAALLRALRVDCSSQALEMVRFFFRESGSEYGTNSGWAVGAGTTFSLVALKGNARRVDEAMATAALYIFRCLGPIIGVSVGSSVF
jgi:hypothetical protein